MHPIDAIKGAGLRLIVMPPNDLGVRIVYGVRRLRSADLAGLPAIDLAQARTEESFAEEEETRLLGATTEADRERVRNEVQAAREAQSTAVLDELVADPAKARAVEERFARIVCATVEAVGIALDGVPEGVAPVGTPPAEVCEVQDAAGTIWHPLRFVQASPGAGELALSVLSDAEVVTLGGWITRAYSVHREVRTFRGAAGAAAPGGQDRAEVRGPAERDPPRPGRPGGRARSGGAPGRRGGG